MVKINSKTYNPKISNSILLLFASEEGIDLADYGKMLAKFSYEKAVKLFVFAVNKGGGELTENEVHQEVDVRIDAVAEIMTFISDSLAPKEDKKKVRKGV